MTEPVKPISEMTAEEQTEALLQELALRKEIIIMGREMRQRKWCPQSPTKFQQAFLKLEDDEAFYGGAGGGGKSSALLMGALQHVEVPGYAAIIFRRTYAELSKPGALLTRAHEWLRGSGARWNEQKKQWKFPSGAMLQFGHMESENDKYNYASDEYQYIAFDELSEFTESQYTFLFSRRRRLATADVPLRTRAASNPGGPGAVWVRSRFIPDDFVPEDTDEPRILRKTWSDAETGEEHQAVFVPARLQDNPFVDQKGYIAGLMKLDPVTRAQILKGDWLISPTGRPRFDLVAVSRFVPREPALGELFEFEDQFGWHVSFQARENGLLAVWKRPSVGRRYVMGIDTASGRDANRGQGNPDPDWSVTQVRDADTGEQVARLRGRIHERAFGDYNYLLGRWYNTAFAVHALTGGYGRSALDRMIDRNYPIEQIYCRRDETKLATPADYDYLGFEENVVSRKRLYHMLDMAIYEHAIETFDAVTINEYRTFEINKDGKEEARAGCKDDCVTADAVSVVGIQRMPRRQAYDAQKRPTKPSHYGRWGEDAAAAERRDKLARM